MELRKRSIWHALIYNSSHDSQPCTQWHAVSMVMKYADNIVKVYSTSVVMLLTAVVSVFLFGFHLSLAFFLGSIVVSVSVYICTQSGRCDSDGIVPSLAILMSM